MVNPLLLPDIREMLLESDDMALRSVMNELHPATVAEFVEGLTDAETWQLFEHAPLRRQAEVFSYFPAAKQVEMVRAINRDRLSSLIEAMPTDNRVDLLRRLEPDLVEELLPLVAKAERHDIRLLLSYPEHSAGSIMTTEYASLPAGVTVAEALERLRQQAPHSETIYYVYILDDQRHLLGSISLHELILAKPTAIVGDLMQRDVISVRTDEDQEQVAQKLARYDFIAIPVVDAENQLVGIVTHDDVIDVVVAEATEDALRMGGVGAMVENYLELPFVTILRKRAAWLSCLFIAELFTFTALAYFEDAIAAVLVLSLFVPLCISTGGNSGSQAATLITRAMALGQIRPGDWWRVLKHELLMGVALGLTLGMVGFARGATTPQSLLDSMEHHVEPFEARLPRGVEPLPTNSALELPVGAQLIRPKLDRAALVTLPPGTNVELQETSGDDVIWKFPAGSDIRFPNPIRWSLAIVIAQSVTAICLWGTLIGSMLPLLFRRLGFDPGFASSPFVATFVDVTGIVIYFSIATLYIL